jgi:RNA polymerase sigma factor (sigma-70 family)
LIDNQKLKLLVASIAAGTSLFFTANGIEASVPEREKKYNLQDHFQNSASYTEVSTRFSLPIFVKAHQYPNFKSTLKGVITKNSNQRFISLDGLPPDSFHLHVKEGPEKQLTLNYLGTDYEVEAVTNKSGIVILVDGGRLTSYIPTSQIDFIIAADKPIKDKDETFLLRAIIYGDPESFATYIHENKSRFMNIFRRKRVSEENAEDILQTVQIKYFRLVQSGQWDFEGDTSNMQAMITTMIANAIIDFYRSEGARAHISISSIQKIGDDGETIDITDLKPHEGSDGLMDPVANAERQDILKFLEYLHTEMSKTQSKQFEVFWQWIAGNAVDSDVTQRKVAESFGITEETVKTYVARIRELMQENGLREKARELQLI